MATTSPAPGILRIRDGVLPDLDVAVVGGAEREYREQLTRHLVSAALGTGAIAVAEWDGTVVGRAFVEPWGVPPLAWLGGLVVEEAYRQRGIASALVAYLEERAAEIGYSEIRLSVAKDNSRAQDLYERLGYRTMGEDTSSGLVLSDGTVVFPPEPVWVMRKMVG
jgi:ribosomal protein S18 acetylase RimI-like enzyme